MTSRYDPHDDPRLAARLQAFADAPLATFDASLVVEAAVATAPRRGSPWQLVAAAAAAIAIVVVAAAATDANSRRVTPVFTGASGCIAVLLYRPDRAGRCGAGFGASAWKRG